MTASSKRVRIERDEWAERPDFDAQCPVVFLPYMRYRHYFLIAHGREYLPTEDSIKRALMHLGWEDTQRWLSMFVGRIVKVLDGHDRDGVYVEVATDKWIADMGFTDDPVPLLREQTSPFEHYLDGDVFTLVPEELVLWVGDNGQERTSWEEVEGEHAVGGFYGLNWAVDCASEDFFGDGDTYDVIGPDNDTIKTITKEAAK